MRIDLALKYLCLAKSRSAVKTMCDKNAVTVNDRPAKPSSTLHVDDKVCMTIPEKQLSKTAAPAYYRVLDRTRTDDD